MINFDSLKNTLLTSFEDLRLDADEKQDFISITESLDHEQFNFLRNAAFDLLRSELKENPENALKALKWLENLLKTLDKARFSNSTHSSACFSPGTDCLEQIIRLIKHARHSIDICVFTISDNRITEEIINAHQRGINLRILSDNDKSNDRGSDIDRLSREGIALRLDHSPYHMHHKFALFDQHTLLNGSFNWTRSASDKNEENIVVTNDNHLLAEFQTQFEKIWKANK